MYKDQMVGIGVCTYNRPNFLRAALYSIGEKLFNVVDAVYVHDDGSSDANAVANRQSAVQLSSVMDVKFFHDNENRSVGYAKNRCFTELREQLNCDSIFIMEDDMKVLNEQAVTAYIDAMERTGIQHFNYAHHGPMNDSPLGPEDLLPEEKIDGIEVYTACVGSWSYYTGLCLDLVGGMDPELNHNAYEHVEHTLRCAQANMTMRFWRFPDVVGSQYFLAPQEGSIATSQIRKKESWFTDMQASLDYVKAKHPEAW